MSERAYGVDCRLWVPGRGVNWPIIRATVFDEFVIAHTLGWWAKVWRASAQQVFIQGFHPVSRENKRLPCMIVTRHASIHAD